jgi:Leucine-rich repeat (LRR) protein
MWPPNERHRFLTILSLSRLSHLYVYDNSFTGTVPTEIGLLTNMTHIHAYHNQIEKTIPTELGSLVVLKELMLSGNDLTGAVPSELGNLLDLQMLFLSHNPQLNGTFPMELYLLRHCEALDINETSITISGNLNQMEALGINETVIIGGNGSLAVPSQIQLALNFSFWKYYYECGRRYPCVAPSYMHT